MRLFLSGITLFLVAALLPSQDVRPGDIHAANKRLGRGINLGNALEAPREGAWGVRLEARYFQAIKEAGFDTVRLPVRWSAHAKAEAPYTLDPKFAERVDWAIDQALANKLNIIVNVHHYNELDARPDDHLPCLVAIWEQLAERYKGRPEGVYFELLNEPHDKLTEAKWNDMVPTLLAAVRKTNPTRPVIVGPGQWNALRALDKLKLPADDRHLIVTVHYYDPFEFTHQSAPWVKGSGKWKDRTWQGSDAEQAEVRKGLEKAAAWGKANDRPIFLGEFGAFQKADQESRARWTGFVVREAERQGFSWAYWEFCSGFGAYDPRTGKWREALKSALMPAGRTQESADDLHESARKGEVKRVKELLDGGADVNARNRFGATALWFAAYKNRADVVKLLLERKADPDLRDNAWTNTPLEMAFSFDGMECARLLLAAGAKGADDLLLRAAMQGKAEIVACVLEHRKPSAEVLGAALLVTTAKDVKQALTKAGAKALPPGSAEEQKQWKALEGAYENPNGRQMVVRMRDGVLMTSARGGPSALRRVEGLVFRFVGDDDSGPKLRFEMKDGKVARITLGEVAYEPRGATAAAAKPGPFQERPAVVKEVRNWPSFRGEGATGVADGQHPPGAWDVKKLGAGSWKTPIPGLGHSCPVVWGDKVFVTTAVSSDPKSELKAGLYGAGASAKDRSKHTWKVYCVDRKSGKILWERTAVEGVPKIRRHTKATHANATAATDGRHLVVSFASEGLFCYDLTGKLLWRQDLGLLDAGAFNDPDLQWEAASSPVVWRGLAFLQCDRQKDSYMAAYRLDSGERVWRTARDEGPSWGTPTVVEGKGSAELVANGTTAVRGYDPLSGKELWSLGRNSQITVPTPFVGDGLIYVTSGYAPIQPIYAVWPGARGNLTLKDGQESSDQVAWSKTRAGPYMPTPVYYGGYLYVCSNSGQLACYEGRTGKQVYRERLGAKMGYTASPVAADGRLYFTGEDGKVSVVEAGPVFKLLVENEVGETCLATPAIAGGMIFFRTQSHLLGIGRPEM